jgi:E3 ubiquitin-protein ligase TRIP12
MAPLLADLALCVADPAQVARLGWVAALHSVEAPPSLAEVFDVRRTCLVELIGPACLPLRPLPEARIASIAQLMERIAAGDAVVRDVVECRTLAPLPAMLRAERPARDALQTIADYFLNSLVLRCEHDMALTPAQQAPLLLTHALDFRLVTKLSLTGGGVVQSIDPRLDFAAIVAWLELHDRHPEKIARWRRALAGSEIAKYIDAERGTALPLSLIGAISFSPYFLGPKTDRFEINQKMYAYHEHIMPSLFRAANCLEGTQLPDVIVRDASVARDPPPFVPPLEFPPIVLAMLEILRVIHELDPAVNMHNKQYVAQLRLSIRSAASLIACQDAIAPLVFHFPFLFPFSDRLALFRILAFDPSYSFPAVDAYALGWAFDELAPAVTIRCFIDRANLKHCAEVILRTFGPGIAHLDCQFRGESHFGRGQTQEFISLYAKTVFGPGAWLHFAGGLYPRPDAEPDDFQVLGLMVGKALIMDLVVPLNLHTAFLKLALAHATVSLADIDPSLDSTEFLIGAQFTIPGHPAFPLADDGGARTVTAAHAGVFRDLLASALTSGSALAAAESFADGIAMVLRPEFFRILAFDEIAALIRGIEPEFAEADIAQHLLVQIDDAREREWGMLREVLRGMDTYDRARFVYFVTGCTRLPLGGLAQLKPRITVIWKSEMMAPAADMTTHQLTLPMYGNRDRLRVELIAAARRAAARLDLLP